jgi:hypothetical protein
LQNHDFIVVEFALIYFRFFSELVAESLIDFQCKVAQVVKAVGLALDDFDLVVHSLQFSGVDGVVTVVQDAVAVTFQHLCKFVQGAVIQGTGQGTPLIQYFTGPGSGLARPDMSKNLFIVIQNNFPIPFIFDHPYHLTNGLSGLYSIPA